jgi:diguanylate cyclase (GGDEF)-like protein/PAS domain S-box-containing protein
MWDSGKRPSRTLAVARLIKRRASKRFSSGRAVISELSTINQLRSEIDLLTSYSTDTIYRLRYDTMRYDYISPSVVRLLGYSPEEMKKLNIRKLIVETRIVTDGMKAVNSYSGLEATRKKGDVNKWQADYLIRTKDGRNIWVSDVSYPWFDDKGSIIGSVGSLRDITERMAAETEVKSELIRIANTDSLTGLANRRHFFEKLDEEMKRVKRSKAEIAILVLDVDHFKKINDQYGHDAGDKVLIDITRIMSACLRETDLAGRIGGEEFAMILPDTPVEGAYWVAERIRASVAKHTFTTPVDKQRVQCTVSIGVSSSKAGDMLDATRLFKQADNRLYIAKNTGRNQVSIDELMQIH